MEKRKPEEYAFPCSVIRANERKILSKQDLDKLVDMKSVNQAVAALQEFGYGDGKELANPRDFDNILTEGLNEAYELVFSVLPDEEELELFRYPNDYHNVKALLKAEALKLDPEPYMVNTGNFTPVAMEEMIRERHFTNMRLEMKQAINETLEVFSKGGDPQEIDIILDRACYKDMYDKAMEVGNEFITGYVRLLVDILNVSSFVRLKQINKPWSFYQKIFLPGGYIDERVMVASWDEGYQQLAEKLAPFGFRDVFQTGVSQIQQAEGSFTEFEKLSDNLRMKYVKDAKYVSFGVEPLVGYLIAKELEVKNLRMILTGIVAEIPKETTLERLRVPYV